MEMFEPQIGPVNRVLMLIQEVANLQTQTNENGSRLEGSRRDYKHLSECTGGNISVMDNYDLEILSTAEQREMYAQIFNLRQSLITSKQAQVECQRDNILPMLETLLRNIRHETARWHRAQALAANGKPVEQCHIEQLVTCCGNLSRCMYTNLEQVVCLLQLEVHTSSEAPACRALLEQIRVQYENLLKEIVACCLIVEQQPPQVLMKDKKFHCHLRHLVGDGLNIHETKFSTKMHYISNENARYILTNGPTSPVTEAGKVSNNEATSDFYEQSRQLQVHMRGMTLTMKQRGADRNKAEIVAEDKNCMIFRATIKVRFPSGTECNVIAQTMSLPIVVTSHGKQEAASQGTIFWDNAFCDVVRQPFDVPCQVTWEMLLDGLHWIWIKECENEPGVDAVGLTSEARRYLTHKLFGTEFVNPSTPVNFAQFNRPPQNKPFSFWTWFYSAKELVSHSCVKKFWNQRLIEGFVSKPESEQLLMKCNPGTFMFRFSDSVPGALSVCFIRISGDAFEVDHLQPERIKDFVAKSLPDQLRDNKYLHFLYPDKAKDFTFGPYYTPVKCVNDHGYIPTVNQVVPANLLMCDDPPPSSSFMSPVSNRMGTPASDVFDNVASPPLFDPSQMDLSNSFSTGIPNSTVT